MLAFRVEFLLGKAVAAGDDAREPEWPPHPVRLFAALVSALHESLGNSAPHRGALEWLEGLGAPEIVASECCYGHERAARGHYVPVSDDHRWTAGDGKRGGTAHPPISAYIPLGRKRQLRHFPSVVPRDPAVYFVWREAKPSAEVAGALGDLASRVAYLGHSSSLVAVSLSGQAPPPTLVPHGSPPLRWLRVPEQGALRVMEEEYYPLQVRQKSRSTRLPTGYVGYGSPSPPKEALRVQGPFGTPIVFRRTAGPTLPASSAYGVARAFRSTWLRACQDEGIPMRDWLTGHTPEGGPSQRPHVAIVPLPFVADPERNLYADGHLMGVAVVPPAALTEVDRREFARALEVIGPTFHVPLGSAGVLSLDGRAPRARARTLDVRAWTEPSPRWASVTPVVLDRYPKRGGLFGDEATDILANSCLLLGLPRPREVRALPVSVFRGAPASRDFPPVRVGSAPRVHTHAILEFPVEVAGPLLLGAGRYAGMGLLRPWLAG